MTQENTPLSHPTSTLSTLISVYNQSDCQHPSSLNSFATYPILSPATPNHSLPPYPFCSLQDTHMNPFCHVSFPRSYLLILHLHLLPLIPYLNPWVLLLLLRHPFLPLSPVDCSTMAFLQWNIQGFCSHRPHPCHLIFSYNLAIICLQENFLTLPPVPILNL